ncbi:MAG TPA: NAD-dependent epimerase/dehydratase family protein [Acidobacteriaceae bacterium]
MSKKKALVTGGCGFVGRHMVKALLSLDYQVTLVDNLSTGLHPGVWPAHLRIPERSSKDVTFFNIDFRAYVRGAEPKFDLICHLAAVVGGRMTIDGDPLAVATDLAIDADLFNWVVGPVRPQKLLYFSSSAAYPISLQSAEVNRPLSEGLISFGNSIGVPDMTYGWSKLTGEFLAGFAVQKYGLDVVIYRPFSGYGEDQDFTYPFPSIVRRVAQRESPVVVWGSGEQLRDFIYIDDAIDAALIAKDQLAPGDALNLGSGVGTSFRRLAEITCEVLGHKAPIVNDQSKPEGVFARVGDCQRMLRYYQPKVSLREGIERTHEYQNSQQEAAATTLPPTVASAKAPVN